ncbi:hypothetical protein BsWGS_16172 [Bradybaena similaris]
MAFSTYRLNYSCSCGGNRSYGKTLYVFGGSSPSSPSTSASSTAVTDTKGSQTEDGSPAKKEDISCRLRQLEKVHKANVQDKEDTISSLRNVILEHEKHMLELQSRTDGNSSVHDSPAASKVQSSPLQKLLDQIDRLQKEKDVLLRKVADLESKQTDLGPMQFDVNNDLAAQAELSKELESCTTDTEKELAKIKRVKHLLTVEIQKLQRQNAQLCDKLSSLGVDTSDFISSVKNSSSSSITQSSPDNSSSILGDSGYLGGILQQELEQNTAGSYFSDKKADDTEKKRLKEALANTHHLIGSVFQDFLQVKSAYLLLKQEMKALPSSMEDSMKEMQIQVQKSLTDMNAKYKEVVDKYLREMKLRKKYHNELVELRGNIRVLCRVRPWIKEDGFEEDTIVVTLDSDDDSLIKINNKGRMQLFDVDKVFGPDCSQCQVFDEVSSLVRSVIDGYNVCIFAYGQTGSGKTYTMEGPVSDPGINQRALQLLFEETVDENWQYEITASVLEIYNEVIRDLLNPDQENKLEVKIKPGGGLHVPGLFATPVSDLSMVNQIFKTGRRNRATASTNMNEHSSRSHCLLCITVTGHNPTTGSQSLGHLNLVDLAGSERVSKSMADGIHLKEAQNINKSLSCLGDVIHALRNKHSHVPYRNSKLTYLLQDSLGGDSKTLMIVQVSPVQKNVNETVCALQFGQRVRSIELGTPSKNVDLNKSTPTNRPSSLLSSSPSSSMLSTPSSSMPSTRSSSFSNLLSPISPSSPFSKQLKQSISSPALSRKRQPLSPSQNSQKSPSKQSPLIKSPMNTITPTSQMTLSKWLNGDKKSSPSSQNSFNSSTLSSSRKLFVTSMTPNSQTSVDKKPPQSPNVYRSPVISKAQHLKKNFYCTRLSE